MARGRLKTVSEETRQEAASTQAALTALSGHPSWEVLIEVVQERRAQLEKEILARMIPQVTPTKPIPQAELYYLRGVIHGMQFVAGVPNVAETQLIRFLEARGIKTEEMTA